jgi:hypothetical protein
MTTSNGVPVARSDLILARLEPVCRMLAECKDAGQAKAVADLAHAAEVYARRQKLGKESIASAHAVIIDAMTLMGDYLRDAPKQEGARGRKGGGTRGSQKELQPDAPPTLEALGISKKESSDSQALAAIKESDPGLHAEVRSGGKTILQARIEEKRNRKKRQQAEAPPLVLASNDPRWSVDQADCLDWFAARPADPFHLTFGSPPFQDARLYLEGGDDLGIARGTDEWVAWMVKVYQEALRCCTGLVAFVVAGRTRNYSWSAAPALLMAALVRAGITLRNPPIYRRQGTPGSGGPDWLRSDYEWIVCATRGGPLPWSDNTALGHPPRRTGPTRFGNKPSRATGKCGEAGERRTYFNGNGYGSTQERKNRGSHRAQRDAGCVVQPPVRVNPGNVVGYATCGHKNGDTVSDCRYVAPEMVNPGNIIGPGDVIDCGSVGGGKMGDDLCHDNEAPFPEALAEFFIRSFCPPGGIVCDCFSGSGTTAAVALKLGRRFAGCDLRKSQVELTKQRIARVQQSEADAAPTR